MYAFNSYGHQYITVLNFTAIDLKLYKILKIMCVSFLGHILVTQILHF